MDGIDRLRRQLEQLRLPEAEINAAVGAAQEAVDAANGELYCATEDLLDARWERYTRDDFIRLRRDWSDFSQRLPQDGELLQVYSTTRNMAYEANTYAGISTALCSINGMNPVRLCAFPNSEDHADKAHLCPKTGVTGKTDTWLYAASATLGMECETEFDRVALSKALRGSHRVGARSVSTHTGLNRSPFNLLLFMEQKRYFDESPGVIVLPILDLAGIKSWNGGSYSVIILCSRFIRTITPSQMAVRIGLTSTNRALIEEASPLDMDTAVGTLRAVVKASAYCLEVLPPPESHRARALWQNYRDSVHQTRVVARLRSLNDQIQVPSNPNDVPTGKSVARINLANMAPGDGRAAYPDPMLLVHKSSVNWTRQHHFQLMAEAEPSDEECPGDTGESTAAETIAGSLPNEIAVG